MNTFAIRDVADELAETGAESTESLRTDNVSLEVMRFEPGDEDTMHAHGEDEIYVVESGTAELNVEGDATPVSAGDVVHLEPGTEHRFQAFEDELVMTVVYAPATGTQE
jgi:quercetin dioxygenase-like cupin family protein